MCFFFLPDLLLVSSVVWDIFSKPIMKSRVDSDLALDTCSKQPRASSEPHPLSSQGQVQVPATHEVLQSATCTPVLNSPPCCQCPHPLPAHLAAPRQAAEPSTSWPSSPQFSFSQPPRKNPTARFTCWLRDLEGQRARVASSKPHGREQMAGPVSHVF